MLSMEVVLPDHIIIEEILSRLPSKSLLRFRCACKTWSNIISGSMFRDLHLKRSIQRGTVNNKINLKSANKPYTSYLMPDCENPNQVINIVYPSSDISWPVHYLGSCNGLVCLAEHAHINNIHKLCVWNPSTRKYVMIPQHFPEEKVIVFSSSSYGFFYDSISSNYKLLKITSYNDSSCSSQVMVYSFGENSWTQIADISYRYFLPVHGGAVLVNGAMHWLALDTKSTEVLVAFDTVHETFFEIPLPENYKNDGKCRGRLTELAGCLSLVCKRDGQCEVWLMKNYGRKESWTKLLLNNPSDSIYNSYFWPLYITSKGDLLVRILGNNGGLFLYDQESFKKIDIVEKHPATGVSNEIKNPFLVWQLNYVDSLTSFKISDGEQNCSSGERSSRAHMKLPKDAGVLLSETQ